LWGNSIIQINFSVGNYLMIEQYYVKMGQVEPTPEPQENPEVPDTGDHNDDNEDPA
jgi:hypothetical protein